MKRAKPTLPGVVVHRIAQPGEDDFSTPVGTDSSTANAPKPPPGSAPSGLDVMSARVRQANTFDKLRDDLPPNAGIL